MDFLSAFNSFSTFYGAWIFLELAVSIVRAVFSSKASKAYFELFGKDRASYTEYYKNHKFGKKAILFGRLIAIPLVIMVLILFFIKSASNFSLIYGVLAFAIFAEIALEATRAVFDILFANSVISDIKAGRLKNDRPIEVQAQENKFDGDFVQNEPEKKNDAPKAKFCDECGAPIKEGSLFCEGCGKKLS